MQLEEDQAQAEVGEGREDAHSGCGFALDVRAAMRDVVEDREGTCNADPGQEETGWACGCSTKVNELVSEKHVE